MACVLRVDALPCLQEGCANTEKLNVGVECGVRRLRCHLQKRVRFEIAVSRSRVAK